MQVGLLVQLVDDDKPRIPLAGFFALQQLQGRLRPLLCGVGGEQVRHQQTHLLGVVLGQLQQSVEIPSGVQGAGGGTPGKDLAGQALRHGPLRLGQQPGQGLLLNARLLL